MGLFGHKGDGLYDILRDPNVAEKFLESGIVTLFDDLTPAKSDYQTKSTVVVPKYYRNYQQIHYGPDFAGWLKANSYQPPTGVVYFYFFTTYDWLKSNGIDPNDVVNKLMKGRPFDTQERRAALDGIVSGFGSDNVIREETEGILFQKKFMYKKAMGFYTVDKGDAFIHTVVNIVDKNRQIIPVIMLPSIEVFRLRSYPTAKEAFDAYRRSVSQAAASTS